MSDQKPKPVRIKTIYAAGYKRNGKITLDDAFMFNVQFRRIPDGTRLQFKVGPPQRSDEANNYMWLVLTFIEEHAETGHTAEELHEYFKRRFLPKRVAIADGNGVIHDDVVIGGSTSNLNQQEFYDYVEKIRHFAITELQCETPDPDPKLARRNRRTSEKDADRQGHRAARKRDGGAEARDREAQGAA